MIFHRYFIGALALSLAAHLTLLCALTRWDTPSQGISPLRKTEPAIEARLVFSGEDSPYPGIPAAPTREHNKQGSVPTAPEEATVDLENSGTIHTPYLLQVKQAIEKTWAYPPESFQKKEQGYAVVKLAIEPTGKLANCTISQSSGWKRLDYESIMAIRRSSPFPPFSDDMRLSRLTIIARFNYYLPSAP